MPLFLRPWWHALYVALCLVWVAAGIVNIVGGKWAVGVIMLCAALTVLCLVANLRFAYRIGYSQGQISVYDQWTAWLEMRAKPYA